MDFNPRLAVGILVFAGLLVFGVYRLVFGTMFSDFDSNPDLVQDVPVPDSSVFPTSVYSVGLGDVVGLGGSEHPEAVGGAQEPPRPVPGSCWVYCRDPLIYPLLVEFNPSCEVVLVTD